MIILHKVHAQAWLLVKTVLGCLPITKFLSIFFSVSGKYNHQKIRTFFSMLGVDYFIPGMILAYLKLSRKKYNILFNSIASYDEGES